MSGRGNGFVCRISATVTFASVVCFPTRFGASRIFFIMMFNVVTECRYIGLCNDNRVANRAMLAFGFTFFSACRCDCCIYTFGMTECGNFLISGITTTYAFTSIVFVPTDLCAGCGLSGVMFDIVTEFARRISFQFNMAYSTFFIYVSVLFTSCSNVNNPIARSMSERRNFTVRRIIASFAFAGYVFFPTFFGAGCWLSGVIFQIVTESIDFCLGSQYLSAL